MSRRAPLLVLALLLAGPVSYSTGQRPRTHGFTTPREGRWPPRVQRTIGPAPSRADDRQPGAVLEVCPDGCPYATIQSAIDATVDGDTVLVHDGRYEEHITISKAITVQSVNGAGRATIDGGGAGRVVTGRWEPFHLAGFTITNGAAYTGGGIYIEETDSSAQVSDCLITNNTANSAGGGIGLNWSGLSLTRCAVIGNSAPADWGGGLYLTEYSGAGITDSVISNNSGGGIYGVAWAFINVRNSDISGNTGPGISVELGSIDVANCRLVENTGFAAYGLHTELSVTDSIVTGNGAGIGAFWDSTATITGTTLTGNAGVAISLRTVYGSVTVVSNCTVSGNRTSSGGAVTCWGSTSLTMVNCTVSNNYTESATAAAGLHAEDPHLTVLNSILWGNESAGTSDQVSGPATVTYSNVQGGWAGVGNIDEDPLFVDPRPASAAPTADGNHHLRRESPSIDTGTADGAPPDDIDGDARPVGAGFDMGSDEYGPTIFIDGFESGDRSAWPRPYGE